jgi:ArsR family transcriptional regulator
LISCCKPGRTCEVESERACVGDLGADTGLAPSTVSHHIKELRQAGLIEMKRSGQRVECWVPSEVLEFLSDFFSGCCTGEVADAIQLSDRNSMRS